MYKCKSCLHRTHSLKGYVQHYQLHSNEANIKFPCGIQGCSRFFRTYSAFKSHITRDHGPDNQRVKRSVFLDVNDTETVVTKCALSLCGKILQNVKDLLQHLKGHILDGNEVQCPFEGCSSKFRVKSTFSSHLSRKHANTNRKVSPGLLIDEPCRFDNDLNDVTHENNNAEMNIDLESSSDQDEPNLEEDFTELFLKNLALFYMKLTAKHHVPATTIQMIVSEMKSMHDLSQNCFGKYLKNKLRDIEVPEIQINDVIEGFSPNDIFNSVHESKGPLSTEYRRKQFYKQNFNFVEPISLHLGLDNNNVERYFEYVPIIKSIEELLKDPGVKHQFDHPIPSCDDVLRDFMDGNVAKKNILFIELPNTMKLILYQDAFEVVNPLGSAKRKHKILAVYFTLGNIYPQYRSKIDQLQLVLLVRELDFKYFGQDAVFRPLINDLKKIETIGLLVENEYVRGTITMFLGDNLGSHAIGGFVENFSCLRVHVCRFCLITLEDIKLGNLHDNFDQRSPVNYNESLAELERNPELNNFQGVKFDSIFNELQYYHVCNPGLPPCLGHDLFEGVVYYDLAIFIHYMVKVKKWFTYAILNQIIVKFKYRGSDANNKPGTVNEQGSKLGGHAVQNWCLLRLLPVLVGSKISDNSDPVWQLILLLRTIVELVCAPEITLSQVAYLRVIIDEYLEKRFELFPLNNLRPKHHYLSHYPSLILQFGPLIRVWTLRFESKHSYFKRCARYSQNFINVCHTFAQRHQLLQAYMRNGSLFGSTVNLENGILFNPNLYNDNIKNAFMAHHASFEGVISYLKGDLNGVHYEKGLYIVIGSSDYKLLLGEIVMLFQHNATDVCFLVKKSDAEYINEMGYYKISNDERHDYECLCASHLKTYSCLPAYRLSSSCNVVVLKHAILDS